MSLYKIPCSAIPVEFPFSVREHFSEMRFRVLTAHFIHVLHVIELFYAVSASVWDPGSRVSCAAPIVAALSVAQSRFPLSEGAPVTDCYFVPIWAPPEGE